MKTGALSTKRKFDSKLAVDLIVERIRRWTQRELKITSADQKTPICWALSNGGFLVGKFQIEKCNDVAWTVYDQNKDKVHIFGSKNAAIFYCLCAQVNRLDLSLRILKYDRELGDLDSEALYFRNSLHRAKQRNDEFKLQLWNTRNQLNQLRRQRARALLEKTIRSAKYLKLWEETP